VQAMKILKIIFPLNLFFFINLIFTIFKITLHQPFLNNKSYLDK